MRLLDLRDKYLKGQLSKQDYINEMYACHNLLFEYSNFIPSTNISEINIIDNTVIAVFRDSGIKFICITGDKRLAPLDTINFSQYEADELKMQLKLIEPNTNIVDIGANLGWYSMHIAKSIPSTKIYSFEPIPRTFEYLNKNISLNNLSNIQTIQKGLSDQNGFMEIFFDPFLSVNASFKNVSESANAVKITCEIDTLDNYALSKQIPSVDFIKCDVEGAEFLVLKGAVNTLINSRPIVFCEMLRKWSQKFNYHPNEIIDFMHKLNYDCFIIENNNLKKITQINDNTTQTNFIFLNIYKHMKQINDFVK